MEYVGQFAQRLDELPDSSEDEPLIEHTAYWTAAVVTYTRCFGAGSRRRYAHSVPIPTRQHSFHQWLLAFRNNNIAHISRTPLHYESDVIFIPPPADYALVHGQVAVPSISLLHGSTKRLIKLADVLEHRYSRMAQQYEDRIIRFIDGCDEDALRATANRRGTLHVDDGST
jgi:hypothetical protein